MKDIEPATLRVDEAVAYIGISRAGIWRQVKKGALPAVRIGGRTLFRRCDLDALIERCTQTCIPK